MQMRKIIFIFITILIYLNVFSSTANIIDHTYNKSTETYIFKLKVDLPKGLECYVRGKYKYSGINWVYDKGFEGSIGTWLKSGIYEFNWKAKRITNKYQDFKNLEIDIGVFDIRSIKGKIDVRKIAGKYVSIKEISVSEYKNIMTNIPEQPDYSTGEFPIVRITYDEALKFAKKVKGDLLTEQEWKSIAKKTFNINKTNANWGDDGKIQLEKCGYNKQLVVYDIAGNVWEWVKSNSKNGKIKGGGWLSKEKNINISTTETIPKSTRNVDVGIRIIWR